MSDLTAAQLYTLRHMLGINDLSYARPTPNRNYGAVSPGDVEFAEMTGLGVVECYHAADDRSVYDFFRVTEAGKVAAFASYMEERWPRARRRYHRFLDLQDAFNGLTFREFLTDPEFAEVRRTA